MTTPTETLRVLLTEAEARAVETEKALQSTVREATQRVRDARAAHLEAVETRTNLRRALGLNADGTQRKARGSKQAAPETEQPALAKGWETTEPVTCEAQGVAA